MPDVLTIREAVERAKAEGMPVSEYTLRRWVRSGEVPSRKVGSKNLIFYPNLIRYLQCEDGVEKKPATLVAGGIRRLNV